MAQILKKTKNIPAFLKKLYNMLEDRINECAVVWSSNGIGFGILNDEILAQQVLPKYFKHSNYSSFIRQLNMYGFHKVKNGDLQNYFHHDKFIQGDLHSISQIERKPQKKKALKNNNIRNVKQNQRFYCQSQIRQQKNTQKKVTNKTQITLNSVHTIKAKSQESIILMRENNNLQPKDGQVQDYEYDLVNENNFSKIDFNQGDSFENHEQMDIDSCRMSINNQLQSKSLFEHQQKQILVPSFSNLFTFVNPYQLGNFGLLF